MTRVRAATVVNGTGDVSRLPVRADIAVGTLPSTTPRITAVAAVLTAEARFGLSAANLDEATRVVRATVSIAGSASHSNEAAWIVTANDSVTSPVTDVTYQKLCIVVSAITGKFLYAYAAEPR